jgi:hypothetical protein
VGGRGNPMGICVCVDDLRGSMFYCALPNALGPWSPSSFRTPTPILSKKSVMDPTDDVLQLLRREELTLFWASRVQWLHRDCTQLAPDLVAGPRRA